MGNFLAKTDAKPGALLGSGQNLKPALKRKRSSWEEEEKQEEQEEKEDDDDDEGEDEDEDDDEDEDESDDEDEGEEGPEFQLEQAPHLPYHVPNPTNQCIFYNGDVSIWFTSDGLVITIS